MRIAILNVNRRLMGGVETYLQRLIPALAARGHDVGLLYETDEPEGRAAIEPTGTSASWGVASLGSEATVAALRDWRPDLVYSHTLKDPVLEERLARIAPALVFAHTYVGTCVSGAKTTKFFPAQPCHRRFGWPCLLHYFPRGCGGWSPLTMGRRFLFEARRLELLRQYRMLLVASPHMAAEYARHGLGDRVSVIPLPVPAPADITAPPAWTKVSVKLLFLGRAEFLKGGHLLLEALPRVQAALLRQLVLTVAGEGPALAGWRRQAAQVMQRHAGIEVRFTGWVDDAQKRELFGASHLVVLPSIWPEPFGMVGLEAAHHGIPAAAFNVGGISNWLKPGVNGCLAPGNPPSAAGLAEAMVACVRDAQVYGQLCQGAREAPKLFTLQHHLDRLHEAIERTLTFAPKR